jgi:hypothetical protein
MCLSISRTESVNYRPIVVKQDPSRCKYSLSLAVQILRPGLLLRMNSRGRPHVTQTVAMQGGAHAAEWYNWLTERKTLWNTYSSFNALARHDFDNLYVTTYLPLCRPGWREQFDFSVDCTLLNSLQVSMLNAEFFGQPNGGLNLIPELAVLTIYSMLVKDWRILYFYIFIQKSMRHNCGEAIVADHLDALCVFKRQILQAVSEPKLRWPIGEVWKNIACQDWIFYNAFDSGRIKFMPSARYRLRILQKLIVKIEIVADPEDVRLPYSFTNTQCQFESSNRSVDNFGPSHFCIERTFIPTTGSGGCHSTKARIHYIFIPVYWPFSWSDTPGITLSDIIFWNHWSQDLGRRNASLFIFGIREWLPFHQK